VLVTLPNFGDERAIANTLRFANLDVPVLIHAFPDVVETMDIKHRRDSFCGKMSACNNLRQYGIKYSLTTNHTMDPNSPAFMADLMWFVGVCRVVRGMKTARLGMMGARPKEFKTVRFSEKLLDQAGISVETLDLSERRSTCLKCTGRSNACRTARQKSRPSWSRSRTTPAPQMCRINP